MISLDSVHMLRY